MRIGEFNQLRPEEKEGINHGIEKLVEAHPRLEVARGFITHYLDTSQLKNTVRSIERKMRMRRDYQNLTPDEKNKIISGKLEDYLFKGELFGENGKRVILRTGLYDLSKKPFFLGGRLAKKQIAMEDYIGRAVKLAKDIIDYGGEVPRDVRSTAEALKNVGWYDVVTDYLAEKNLLKVGEYGMRKAYALKVAERGVRKIKNYNPAEGLAAAVFGVVGLALIFASGLNLTGGVIGADLGRNFALGTIGTACVISSVITLLVSFRKR